MPPSRQQHGQQATGGGDRGRGFTSTTSRRRVAGALHTPGGGARQAGFCIACFRFKFATSPCCVLTSSTCVCACLGPPGWGSHQHDALRRSHRVQAADQQRAALLRVSAARDEGVHPRVQRSVLARAFRGGSRDAIKGPVCQML